MGWVVCSNGKEGRQLVALEWLTKIGRVKNWLNFWPSHNQQFFHPTKIWRSEGQIFSEAEFFRENSNSHNKNHNSPLKTLYFNHSGPIYIPKIANIKTSSRFWFIVKKNRGKKQKSKILKGKTKFASPKFRGKQQLKIPLLHPFYWLYPLPLSQPRRRIPFRNMVNMMRKGDFLVYFTFLCVYSPWKGLVA